MTGDLTCIFCGEPLSICQARRECTFCGALELADHSCPRGHYVCEACRLSTPTELIRRTCKTTRERDPIALATLLMRSPAIRIHGPEHHLLAACAPLAALRNDGVRGIDEGSIDTAIARARHVPLGVCGLWGACGAALGAGIAASIALGADLMSDRVRSLAMRLTSEAMAGIASIGGPRCCKASTFTAIDVAVRWLRQEYGVDLPAPAAPMWCPFQGSNLECLGARCPYHG